MGLFETYVRAVKPSQRAAIRSLQLLHTDTDDMTAVFTTLSGCNGLCHLVVDMSMLCKYIVREFEGCNQIKGYTQLVTLRGLKSFTIKVDPQSFATCAEVSIDKGLDETTEELYARTFQAQQDEISSVICRTCRCD